MSFFELFNLGCLTAVELPEPQEQAAIWWF